MENKRQINIYKDYVTLESPSGLIRVTSDTMEEEKKGDYNAPIKKQQIKALYGIFQLENKYICYVSKARLICQINQGNIYQAQAFEFLPVRGQKTKQDSIYIKMMLELLQNGYFYFSDTYDLTNSLQNQLHKRAIFNAPFFYNQPHVLGLLEMGSLEWVTPFITGLVINEEIVLNGKKCQFIILSRRDRNRAGYRYTSRGSDLDGNVSNFAQNEQLFVLHENNKQILISFLQTRGSMPFLWKSKPTLKYAPTPEISKNFQASQQASKRHFENQIKNLGPQVLINLINKQKNEQKLGDHFELIVNSQKNAQLKYIWFDFHKECAKMKYENLSRLMLQIQDNVKEHKYFKATIQGNSVKIDSLQDGVCRTNCMDCLDRTNVVQSVISRNVLLKVLSEYELCSSPDGSAFQKFPEQLEKVFRACWTVNADAMSNQYTGTPALKTDFTRTGKRTRQGAINDGVNSVKRYFLNNFYDAHKQNCLDVVLGKLDGRQIKYSPHIINPVYSIMLMFISLPVLLKMLFDFQNEKCEEGQKNTFYATFFFIAISSLQIFTMMIKSKLNQIENYKSFVQTPIINQFYN